jgi:hypothetical protein
MPSSPIADVFILSAFDRDQWCPVLQTRFRVDDLEALKSILGERATWARQEGWVDRGREALGSRCLRQESLRGTVTRDPQDRCHDDRDERPCVVGAPRLTLWRSNQPSPSDPIAPAGRCGTNDHPASPFSPVHGRNGPSRGNPG